MLKVNEIFGPTIQGEGKSAGLPCAFLRLSLCNLHCIWCDTPYTWNWEGTPYEHPIKSKKEDEIHDMSVEEVLEKLLTIDTKAIVISGGEPMIQHKALLPVVQKLKELQYWVEIETNGTVYPSQEFVDLLDQINVSPKLANSGNELKARRVPEALHKLSKCGKANFKFVISTEEDVQEVVELIKEFDLKDVYLMPEGRTREELALRVQWTRNVAKEKGVNFSSRIHIIIAGGVRGV